MELADIIKERVSTRSFTGAPLSAEHTALLESLEKTFKSCRLVAINGVDGHVGTYGVVKGAAAAIAVICADDHASTLMRAGYEGEKAVLRFTEAGLGTCWLGGTFRHTSVSRKAKCKDDEFPVAVIVIGYIAEKRRLLDKLMVKMVHSRSRKNFDELFKGAKEYLHKYEKSLELLRLAPSARNAQPWRAVADSRGVHFYYADNGRFAPLDMGIGLCHFLLAEGCGFGRVTTDEFMSEAKDGNVYAGSVLFPA